MKHDRTLKRGDAVQASVAGGNALDIGDARTIVIPHHQSCVRRRPPRWITRAPRRDAGTPRSQRDGWHEPRIRTGVGGAPVRINMTYRNSMITSADFSPKTGRDVYAEGPFEGIYRSRLTTDCDTVEFQFQIAEISWETLDGEGKSYTVDGGRITSAGEERWFELKAHASYFHDPETADLLAQTEAILAEHDIALDRIDGSKLLDRVRQRTVGEVLRFRNAPYDENDVRAAHRVIVAHGGSAPLGAVTAALSPRSRTGHAMACAMLVRRDIGFRLNHPVTDETPVHIPVRPDRGLTRFEA